MTLITAATTAAVTLGRAYRRSISLEILLKTEGNGIIIAVKYKRISATL